MALTKQQSDILTKRYHNRRLFNQITKVGRLQEIEEKIPEIAQLNRQISKLAKEAIRTTSVPSESILHSFKERVALISEQKRGLLLAHGYPANYLDDIFVCPDCKDTGYINGVACHCLKEETRKLLHSYSNLEEILQRENFDTFDYSLYSPDYIDETMGISAACNIETVVQKCQHYIQNFYESFENLLFYGKAGTGKTFLINCIAKELIGSSVFVIYLSATRLFELLADYSFKRNSGFSYSHIQKEELYHCDLLIIDDLGTELANSFTTAALFDCLNERLIHQKSTIISTNLSLRELQDRYEERIFSRIAKYTLLKIFGDDIRIRKNFTL